MPVVGFVDSNGEHFTFDEIRQGLGTFLTRRGADAPRAMLRALANGFRAGDHYGDPNVISVTTLISPIQKVRLEQRHDLYVEWDANIWATYGTVAHGFFEDGAAEGDIVEHKLVIERQGVKIGGTFDLLEMMPELVRVTGVDPLVVKKQYQGRDYKVTSAYGVKGMVQAAAADPLMGVYREKPDYFWQGNLYNAMTQDPDVHWVVELKDKDGNVLDRVLEPWPYAGKVHIDNWALVAVCRDWSEPKHGKVIGPVEVVTVPLLPLERVENYLAQRVELYSSCEDWADDKLPECSPVETWTGKRCAKYCAAAPVCHQIGNGRV